MALSNGCSLTILDIIQSYCQSMKSFYQCGSILLHEHQNEICEISNDISKSKKQDDSNQTDNNYLQSDENDSTSLTGYLFKRTHNNTFKKWTRRWFTLKSSKLYYQKRIDYNNSCISQMEPDLRLCKVREVNDSDRRFVFEIVSPKCRHLLQADSQNECTMWVNSIDKAIGDALNNIGKNYKLFTVL